MATRVSPQGAAAAARQLFVVYTNRYPAEIALPPSNVADYNTARRGKSRCCRSCKRPAKGAPDGSNPEAGRWLTAFWPAGDAVTKRHFSAPAVNSTDELPETGQIARRRLNRTRHTVISKPMAFNCRDAVGASRLASNRMSVQQPGQSVCQDALREKAHDATE